MPTALNEERERLRAFVALLEREQQALINADSDALLTLAEEKVRLADALAASSAARRDTGAPGDDNDPLRQELRQLAAHARQLNQSNGELIQIQLRYNQQALRVLLGAAQQTGALYDANGQTSISGSGRTLGSV